MIKKIVYFRYLPLTKKVFRDFYLDELKKANFEVEYWYLPFILKVPEGMEEFYHDSVRIFGSYSELNGAVKHEDKKSTLFISLQTYGWPVLHLFWLLSRQDCLLAVYGKNTLPAFSYSSNTKKLLNYSLPEITKAFKNRIAIHFKKSGLIKSYDIIFLAGKNGINGYGGKTSIEEKKSVHILINSDDYDRARKSAYGERIIEDKYIVFLDECLPLHPDIVICNIQAMDAKVYYKEINEFFEKIEKETGMPVVIAAHPKALIYKQKDFFNGRMVLFGKTVDLVRDSELVLVHDSTSINYAVCYNKPVISITSDEMERGQAGNHYGTIGLSNYLGTRLIYINKYCADEKERINLHEYKIDEERYNMYKYEFLTNPETQDKQSSFLVIEGIKGLDL